MLKTLFRSSNSSSCPLIACPRYPLIPFLPPFPRCSVNFSSSLRFLIAISGRVCWQPSRSFPTRNRHRRTQTETIVLTRLFDGKSTPNPIGGGGKAHSKLRRYPPQSDHTPVTLCPSLAGSLAASYASHPVRLKRGDLLCQFVCSFLCFRLGRLSAFFLEPLPSPLLSSGFPESSFISPDSSGLFLALSLPFAIPEGLYSSPKLSGMSSSWSEKLKRGGGKRSIKLAPGREKKIVGVNSLKQVATPIYVNCLKIIFEVLMKKRNEFFWFFVIIIEFSKFFEFLDFLDIFSYLQKH